MTITAEQLKEAWRARNQSLTVSDYISQIRRVDGAYGPFCIIQFRNVRVGTNQEPLGSSGSLSIYSRTRLRTPYHVSLRPADELQSRHDKQLPAWYWNLSPQSLEDAIKFACSTGFVVTFSTIKSGASVPLRQHFQSVPRTIDWDGSQYELFGPLLHSKVRLSRLDTLEPGVSVQEYPVFVAKVTGSQQAVCEKVLRLSLGYDHLKTFNLIISSPKSRKERSEDEVDVFFLPRRFDGHVVPRQYEQSRWAFGSFEMAGAFLTSDEQICERTSYSELVAALQDVSIERQSPEERLIENLLFYV